LLSRYLSSAPTAAAGLAACRWLHLGGWGLGDLAPARAAALASMLASWEVVVAGADGTRGTSAAWAAADCAAKMSAKRQRRSFPAVKVRRDLACMKECSAPIELDIEPCALLGRRMQCMV